MGKIHKNVRKIPENPGKQPKNTDKTGAPRCLILKNWHLTCAESYENLFLKVISKAGVHDLCGRKYSHKDLPENFSGMFGKIRARISRTPKICLLQHLWI